MSRTRTEAITKPRANEDVLKATKKKLGKKLIINIENMRLKLISILLNI